MWVEAQGAVVRFVGVRRPAAVGRRCGGGKRGRVRGFSAAARRRLRLFLGRLRPTWGVFITLTYASDVGAVEAKADLHRFARWLLSHGFEAVVWRMELTEAGRIHFHLLCFCWRRRPPYIGQVRLSEAWGRGFVWVEWVDKGHRRRLLRYISKYVGKPAGSLDKAHISDAEGLGRWWGVYGRQAVEYACFGRFALAVVPDWLRQEVGRVWSWLAERGVYVCRFTFVAGDYVTL